MAFDLLILAASFKTENAVGLDDLELVAGGDDDDVAAADVVNVLASARESSRSANSTTVASRVEHGLRWVIEWRVMHMVSIAILRLASESDASA